MPTPLGFMCDLELNIRIALQALYLLSYFPAPELHFKELPQLRGGLELALQNHCSRTHATLGELQ